MLAVETLVDPVFNPGNVGGAINKALSELVTKVGRGALLFGWLRILLTPPFSMLVLAKIFAARRLLTSGRLQPDGG